MRYYLAKQSGGLYDFTHAKIVHEEELYDFVYDHMKVAEAEIRYVGFDDRIGFHVWKLLAPYKDGSFNGMPLFCCWIYSTSSEKAYLNEE